MSRDVSDTCTELSQKSENGHNGHCTWCVHCHQWRWELFICLPASRTVLPPLKVFYQLYSSSGTDELSLFPPSWASQVQTCLILMSLPIPIKTLSESLLPSLCQSLSLSLSLSFWSSSNPANIWWGDKTSSSVSARHSRMEMAVSM